MTCDHAAILRRGQITCSKCRSTYRIMAGGNAWVKPLSPSERGKLGAGIPKPRAQKEGQ